MTTDAAVWVRKTDEDFMGVSNGVYACIFLLKQPPATFPLFIFALYIYPILQQLLETNEVYIYSYNLRIYIGSGIDI